MENEKIREEQAAVDALQITVDDGAVKIPVKNLMGDEIGVYYFHPTDVGILKRLKEVKEKLPAVVEPLAEMNINADGTATDSENEARLAAAERNLYDLCDYLFGGKNTAEAFFGTMKPFSPVDGKFYCENALNAIFAFIAKRFQVESENVSLRVGKYTHGLRSGKHRNGRK